MTLAIDISDFGAVMDGQTDDSAALQAAIDSSGTNTPGRVIIPHGIAVASTISIASKRGLILQGNNGQGYGLAVPSAKPSIKWIGAAGGTMLNIVDPLNLTLRDLEISGDDLADYGLVITGATTGWGVSNYENLSIAGCRKNGIRKTGASGDYGRNHFKRVTVRRSSAATGTARDDAAVVYDGDSGVQDVWDHCEFLCLDNGVVVPNTYGLLIEAGTPRVHVLDSYTKAGWGIRTAASGATPKLHLVRHYSEDTNFIGLPNANTRHSLVECVHPVSGGVSISWGGAAGGGAPLIIDGGYFAGSVDFANVNAPVILANAPQFLSGWPTIDSPQHVIAIGRSQGPGVASAEAHGAVNAAAFVPIRAPTQTSATIYANLTRGTVFPAALTGNATVVAPSNLDASGRDIGREIEYQIIGHASGNYSVVFNAVFKLAGGVYTHSGAGKIDILRFRWDGANWLEIGRSVAVA